MQRFYRYLIRIFLPLALACLLAVTALALGPEAEGKLDAPYATIEARLKAELAKIADGTETSTQIEVDCSDLGVTYSEIAEQIQHIVNVLCRDCSYELFWWGEGSCSPYINGATMQLSMKFIVAPDYRGADEYTVDPEKIAAAQTSIANADAIVTKYKNASDEEKLRGYYDEIRSLCDYDYDTFNQKMTEEGATSATVGSNPWNMIYVFDGDEDTKVICSGFSKAFQYLCDKTDFAGNVNCFCASGIYGAGTHMWNILTLNGTSYVVDAAVDHFMYKAVSGSVEEGYTVLNGKTYSYDALTRDTCTDTALTLAAMDWEFDDATDTLTLDIDGVLGFRFKNSPFASLGAKKVVFESGLTGVADYAFFECTGVEEIVLPEGVTAIGDYAFQGCTSLESVTVPSTVTAIGRNAFSGCSALVSATIPANVTSIGAYAFHNCGSLTGTVAIKEGVTSVAEYAFYQCSSLTGLTLPNSVTSIGAYAFYGCSGLKTLKAPLLGSSLGYYFGAAVDAQVNGSYIPAALTTVTLTKATAIPDKYFWGCANLTDITVPNTVTSIGLNGFSGCKSLTELTIPASVTSIGEYAIHNCLALETVRFLGAPPAIESNAFYLTEAVAYYPAGKGWQPTHLQNYTGTLTWQTTLLDAPVLTEAFNSSTGVRVSWEAVDGAEKYRLLRKNLTKGETGWSSVGETTECTLIDKTAKSASRYTYTVECVDANGSAVSERNETGRTCTYIAMAKITGVTSVDDGLEIVWEKPGGAKNFRLMRKPDGGTWKVLTDVLGNSYVDTDVEPGAKYWYTVRAITLAGDMYINSYNSYGWSGRWIRIVTQPSDQTASSGYVYFTVEAEGANLTYQWQYSTDGKSWANTTLTGYNSDTLRVAATRANSGRQYRCIVSDVSGKSVETAAATFTWERVLLSAPVLTEAFNSSTGVRVSWKAVDGAEQYRLLRKNLTRGETEWSSVGETSECSLIDKSAKSASRYTYTVEGIDADGNAITRRDETGRTCTYIAMAKITSVTSVEDGLEIEWQKPGGAKNFRLMRKVDGGAWKVLTDVLGDSYVDTDVEPGVKYWYTVRAITQAGDMYINSYNSYGWSGRWVQIIAQPTDQTASSGYVYFTVEAEGAGLTYQWQYSTDGARFADTALTGYNSDTLRVAANAANNGRQYRCIVTDKYGNEIITDAATLIKK